jgi:secreted PhoX family phosphatase
MNHDDDTSNPSQNRRFEDVLEVYASRRQLLTGSLALAATSFFGSSALAAKSGFDQLTVEGLGSSAPACTTASELINFEPLSLSTVSSSNGRVPMVSADYNYQPLVPWGTPLKEGITAYDGDPMTRPSADDQANMVGIGHDGMHYFSLTPSGTRGMLVMNNEFGNNFQVMGKAAPESLEDVRLSQHAHGVTVVEINRDSTGFWDVILGRLNRRVHVNSPVTFSGPVAGHALLDSGWPMLGTVNNCANGYTPWGTYLTCEENFNGYFGATDGSWTPTPEQERYGITTGGFGYGWENFDPRFDLSQPGTEQEANRFGWVVEIDPMNPNQVPVKRTAMGRFKHEGVALVEGRGGRVVAYMGDDERFDYIYKFVSSGNWQVISARGESPLDKGTLYVARFNDDGTGDWLPLSWEDNPALQARFDSQAEVLVYARVAADILGATPMDRPEWASVAPNGDIYCTLTNNSRRTEPDAANPLAPNLDGHIIRWRDSEVHVGTTFTWDIFVIAQNTLGTESSFSSPDGLWIDPDGRIFVQTDGGQKDGLQNQLLVGSIYDTAETPVFNRLLSGVNGDEITGIAYTPNRTALFTNTQHPGNGDPAETNFPAPDGSGKIPRDCTFVITRKDGGVVGS